MIVQNFPLSGTIWRETSGLCVTEFEDGCYLNEKNVDELNIVYQNTHVVGGHDSLFYTPVKI